MATADRNKVPTLPGSATPSKTRTRGGGDGNDDDDADDGDGDDDGNDSICWLLLLPLLLLLLFSTAKILCGVTVSAKESKTEASTIKTWGAVTAVGK